MSNNKYSYIFVCYGNADRDILTKQIQMYKQRFHSKIILIISSEADAEWVDAHREIFEYELRLTKEDAVSDAVLRYCDEHQLPEKDTLLIAKTLDGAKLTARGIEIKDPGSMAESYKKALEMLGNMIKPRI
ncbi:hypothetical protein [Butyrivibrio sp. WCD2001]|uniref:hypothetical protein n=1 Tax=Butyrivibrio sp. WCD2001 TaxID=1280681 RepID=UPI0004090AED|nr:hypothetical protein [Butyrivibrio sp. WCD2001]